MVVVVVASSLVVINRYFKRKLPMWGYCYLIVAVELVLWMVLATAEKETKEGDGGRWRRRANIRLPVERGKMDFNISTHISAAIHNLDTLLCA